MLGCDGPAPDGGLSPCPCSLSNCIRGQEMAKKRGRVSLKALEEEEVIVVQWLPSRFCFAELYE